MCPLLKWSHHCLFFSIWCNAFKLKIKKNEARVLKIETGKVFQGLNFSFVGVTDTNFISFWR